GLKPPDVINHLYQVTNIYEKEAKKKNLIADIFYNFDLQIIPPTSPHKRTFYIYIYVYIRIYHSSDKSLNECNVLQRTGLKRPWSTMQNKMKEIGNSNNNNNNNNDNNSNDNNNNNNNNNDNELGEEKDEKSCPSQGLTT
ncbi:hypothetical protein RFI_37280, partial [Reticulomyxa filosa]